MLECSRCYRIRAQSSHGAHRCPEVGIAHGLSRVLRGVSPRGHMELRPMGGRGVSQASVCGQCSRQWERNHVEGVGKGQTDHKGLWATQSETGPREGHEQRRGESSLNLARPLWLPHGKRARVAPGIRVEATTLVHGHLRRPCGGQGALWAGSSCAQKTKPTGVVSALDAVCNGRGLAGERL